jgi:tRNA (mo5U34)-methyltransferase
MVSASASDLRSEVERYPWYHSIDLGNGVVTPGMFDHKPILDRYPLPDDLSGLRCLDVATMDGFWAFEMERRGAEVTALDLEDRSQLDYPPRRRPKQFPKPYRGDGFFLAKEALDSKVERVICNVYDARPEDLGQFDVVFAGSIVMHVRDQLLALERIASLVKPGGLYIGAEEYDKAANMVPFEVSRYYADRESSVVFWLPSIKTWKRLLWTAGFDEVKLHAKFGMKSPQGFSVPHAVFHGRKGAS